MGWIEALRGQTVGLDAAPLIYFVEENAKYQDLVNPFFDAVSRGEISLVTSTLTLTEVMTAPLRASQHQLARRYQDILLHTDNLTTVPVNPFIAIAAAHTRASHGLRTPDAIHLATAQMSRAAAFITNDEDFRTVPGKYVTILKDLLKR